MDFALVLDITLVDHLLQPLANRLIGIRFWLIMPTRSAQANQNTELSETPPEVFMQVPYCVALGLGRYHFFELISLSIWMSRA